MAGDESTDSGMDGQETEDSAVAADDKLIRNKSVAHVLSSPPDDKSSDVDRIIATYGRKLESLKQQLRVRDSTVTELADENENLTRALSEVKAVVKETITDRERLVDKVKQQQKTLHKLQKALDGAETEVATGRREVSEANREAAEARKDANDARKEATEAGVALADAKAEVWAIREAARGKVLGEDERKELEGALKALSLSSQRAAQDASQWKEKASAWKERVESRTEELENKSKMLALLENELALAQQSLKEAGSRVLEAKRLQEVAEQSLEQLRQESELRTQRFNSAVKAAVGKIQSELEKERDSALNRVQALEAEAESQAVALSEARAAYNTSVQELASSRARISDLERQNQAGKENLKTFEEQVDYWKTASEVADKRTVAAREETERLSIKVGKLESRSDELTAASDAAIRNAAVAESDLIADISRLKSHVATIQNEKQLLQIEFSEKTLKGTAEQIALRAKVAELEEVSNQLRARALQQSTGSRSKLRQGLDNLGLEGLREERLLRREKHYVEDIGTGAERRKGLSQMFWFNLFLPESWTWLQDNHDSSFRGRLSRRSLVVLIYIMALHIMVMVSFTHKSTTCVDILESTTVQKLPG